MICPNCRNPIEAKWKACPHCGLSFVLTQPADVVEDTRRYFDIVHRQSSIGIIATMWILTAISWLFGANRNFSMSAAIDLPAFVIAIVLTTRDESTDRINGWTKLGIELVAIFIVVIIQPF